MSTHGSNAGWRAHQKAGEPPCDPCRLAHNTYQRLRKAAHRAEAAQAAADRRMPTAAHHRALAILQKRHEQEYLVLYFRELKRLRETA